MSPVLLYDGTCGFCARSVQLILRHDRRGTLRFAALQGGYGAEVRSRHPELAGIDSMVWVEPATPGNPERLWVRSGAALQMVRYLGEREEHAWHPVGQVFTAPAAKDGSLPAVDSPCRFASPTKGFPPSPIFVT